MVLVLAACGVTQLEVQRNIPFARMRAELTRALCERTFHACECEQETHYADEDRCEGAVASLTWDIRDRLEGISGDGLSYDGYCVGEYVRRLDELECAISAEEDTECRVPCQFVHGTRGEGEPCELDGRIINDCARGLECLGTCTDPCVGGDGFYAGEGDDCRLRACAEGLACSDDTERCEPLPTAGEPCVQGRCVAGAYCELEVIGDPTSLRCFALGEVGDPCRGHDQCAGGECPNGFCASPSAVGDRCFAACGEGLECLEEACVAADPLLCRWELPEP